MRPIALSIRVRRLLLVVIVSQLFGVTYLFAQPQRPRLRPVRRDYLAGKFILIPPDARPVSLQMPRFIARLADHDVALPPVELLGDATRPGNVDGLGEWAAKAEYGDVEGVIVSLDMLTNGGADRPAVDAAQLKRRVAVIDRMRQRNRGMMIYGLVSDNEQVSALGLDLIGNGKLDFLLICSKSKAAEDSGLGPNPIVVQEITRRGLVGRAVSMVGMDAAPQLLIARMLCHRFGISPRFWIGTSASPGAASLAPMLISQIGIIDGRTLPGTPDAASRADVIMFVNAPETTEEGLAGLLSTAKTAITRGFKVGVMDLSGDAAAREAFLGELRRRKMFDQLIAYSAAEQIQTASGSSIAQATSRAIMMKFLRDDVDRLQRAERAEVELMITRVLTDVLYPGVVQPKLETFLRDQLKVNPEQLPTVRERAELFAREETTRLAEEIFREQFFRNTHSILLSTGERAVFELRSLQRLQLRLGWGTLDEVELRPGVMLPLINVAPPEGSPRLTWDLLEAESLDPRIVRRFDGTYWPAFKTDVEQVAVQFNLNRRELAPESYIIVSKRRSKLSRRFEISSSSAIGAAYALSRLERLGLEGKLVADFTLTEKPAVSQRGVIESLEEVPWSHRDRLDMIRFLGRLRMNRYYAAPKGEVINRDNWREPYTEGDLDRFKELAVVGEESFVSVVAGLAPGRTISYSSDEDIRLLAAKLSSLYGAGLRHFLLMFDDAPETLEQVADRERFRSAAAAQANLANKIYEHLQRLGQGFELSIAPGRQINRQGHQDYLRELNSALQTDIGVVLTGVATLAAPTGAADAAWRSFSGRRVNLVDAFASNEGMEWRPFFGPRNAVPAALPENVTGVVAAASAEAHAFMIPAATLAEFLWDPRQYDANRAFDQALALVFDARTIPSARPWIDSYRGDKSQRHPFQTLFDKQAEEIDAPEIERSLRVLDEALDGFGMKRESGLMRGELASYLRRTRMALRRLANDPAYERLPDARYRLRAGRQREGN